MSDRACVRGCTVRDVHFATCPWLGVEEGSERAAAMLKAGVRPCSGCAPRVARDGVLLCEGCYRRLRRLLGESADLIAHLRSLADPLKAAVYDRVMVSSSRPDLPAPVPADLVDASDDLMRMLQGWAAVVDPGLAGRAGRAARARGEEPHVLLPPLYLQAILADFDQLANRTEITALADAVLHRHSGDPEWWSVVDALGKWPLDDQPRWAKNPCPECDCKTVRVRPPRRKGDAAVYRCTTCDWESDDREDDGFYAEVFAELVPDTAGERRWSLWSPPSPGSLAVAVPSRPGPSAFPRMPPVLPPSVVCPECFTARAVNGACACG